MQTDRLLKRKRRACQGIASSPVPLPLQSDAIVIKCRARRFSDASIFRASLPHRAVLPVPAPAGSGAAMPPADPASSSNGASTATVQQRIKEAAAYAQLKQRIQVRRQQEQPQLPSANRLLSDLSRLLCCSASERHSACDCRIIPHCSGGADSRGAAEQRQCAGSCGTRDGEAAAATRGDSAAACPRCASKQTCSWTAPTAAGIAA